VIHGGCRFFIFEVKLIEAECLFTLLQNSPIAMTVLDELSQVSILEVAQDLGLEVNRNRMVCPFHEENTPSLVLYPHTNSFTVLAAPRRVTLLRYFQKFDS
jgi:hypothetical protein